MNDLLIFGDGVVIGSDVKISAHLGEKAHVWVAPVVLGRGVTIGTNSVVQPGVTIGDEAQVGAMSLVPKGAQLEARCLYAGVPVRLLKRYDAGEPAPAESVEAAPAIP